MTSSLTWISNQLKEFVLYAESLAAHWGRMTHICVSKLTRHCFRLWLGARSVPSHYLIQCWIIVNSTSRNIFQWNSKHNSNFFIHENAIECVVCEMAAILSRPPCVKMFYCLTSIRGWGGISVKKVTQLKISFVTLLVLEVGRIRSSDNDNTGLWPPGSLHTLGADGHI